MKNRQVKEESKQMFANTVPTKTKDVAPVEQKFIEEEKQVEQKNQIKGSVSYDSWKNK